MGDGGGLVNGAGAASTGTNALGIASVTRTLGPAAGPHSDTATVADLPGARAVFSDTAGALVTIQVGNDFFRPQIDSVPTGSFIKFVWGNASFIVRITGVGRYGYHCVYHGGVGSGVFGVIVTE